MWAFWLSLLFVSAAAASGRFQSESSNVAFEKTGEELPFAALSTKVCSADKTFLSMDLNGCQLTFQSGYRQTVLGSI